MQGWRRRLGELGRVESFDYAYAQQGRRAPDRLPKLIETHREALRRTRTVGPSDAPTVLVGKSLGSRVGCHLALEEPIDALVCLGYPLVGAGARAPLRDAVLCELETPILLVQGSRDRLCPLDRLAEVRGRMRAPSALHVVEDGDHSLLVRKTTLARAGETQDDVDARALGAIRDFLALCGLHGIEPAAPPE